MNLKPSNYKVWGTYVLKRRLLTTLFIVGFCSQVLFSQTPVERKITLDLKEATFDMLVSELRKQSKLDFVYNSGDVAVLGKITLSARNEQLGRLLERVLDGRRTNLVFKSENNTIIIKKEQPRDKGVQVTEFSGRVTDDKGAPVPWASIQVVGTLFGCNTDDNGEFFLKLQGNYENYILSASCIGMESSSVKITPGTKADIVLKQSSLELEQVVVTGIFEREKKNFTGSTKTYNNEELKAIGNQNVLVSLKTLDPNFAIIENNTFGSDPNRLPDIEIRGKTSIIGLDQEFRTDPNQPLFILDGFETTLSVISDLSMDRVESITILKDASATAIYGSKAANGVIVVETKRPKAGKLSLTYNSNLKLSFADLSQYNLMDSREKLLFEKLSGHYGSLDAKGDFTSETQASLYYQRLAEVARGVDTYWMADPLRFGFSQGHNIFAEGGDDKMRYGIGLNYTDNQGVMKGSGRGVFNGNIRLIYRWKKFSFTEYLNIDNTQTTREMVPFSEFSRANPYYRKFNSEGELIKILESNTSLSGITNIYNPLYNSRINSFDKTAGISFRNNFESEWRPLNELRLRARFGISKGNSLQETFYSPFHTRFEEVALDKKGNYNERNTKNSSYDGDLSATFGKLYKEKYMVNAVAGVRISSNRSKISGFGVEGFTDDLKPNPAFAVGYQENSRPIYTEMHTRSASYYFNAGFAARNKYLADISLRSDGSSIFGVKNKFTSTWSLGLGWNVSEEEFLKNSETISYLKLRGSVGNPGNQNFDAGMIFNSYTYNSEYQNLFGLSSIISAFGNKDLEWQKTLDANIGFDLEMLDRRLRINFDLYKKTTDPLLVYINVPTSTGTPVVPFNAGSNLTKGYSFTANYTLVRRQDFNWQLFANGRHSTSKYKDIGKLLDKFNQTNITSRSLVRYYDNGSPTDLWAVRSAGIDPATGREIFIKKDGSETFTFDYKDEVVVGNSNPDLEGVIGTSLYYKNFSLSFNVRVRMGGDTFLSALFDKVENISSTSIRYNQDKRALYDRWQKPGDQAKFKAISLTESTQMSSRFVVTENTISGESISVGYETDSKKLHKAGISSVNFRFYLNDIFRLSTIRNERGINYPFERSCSFSIGLRFL